MMPVPDFTPDEQYIIQLVKSPSASGFSGNYMWGYVTGATILAACGVYYQSVYVMAVAFVVLIGFRVYEEYYQKRWIPVWRSTILKYETALDSLAAPDETEP